MAQEINKVVWSPEALDDVDEIAAYIAKDSPYYAEAVVEKIISTSRKLSQLPNRGRIVPEWGRTDIRERFIYSYRLIYQHQDKVVSVIAVIHGRRQLEVVQDRLGE